VSLLAVMLLVLANGFFVATESALVSVRRTRVRQLAAEGNRRAHQVLAELHQLDTSIVATQLGMTIASIGLCWIGELAPKSIALERPEQTALWDAGPIHVSYLTLRPASVFFNTNGNAVAPAFGFEPANGLSVPAEVVFGSAA
jgi:CBS domain containing-hemolysin-like protein